MSRLPAMQFYPADWQSDPGIRALGFFERGVWFEILCLMHFSAERGVLLLNDRAMTDDELARSLGLDKQILTNTLTTLLGSGVASRREEDGAIISRRMVRDERVRQERIKAGKSGGNPNLLKQNPTTRVKQNSTPSSSSTSTITDTDQENPPYPPVGVGKPKTPEPEIKFPALFGDQAKAAFHRWTDYRKKIRKPLKAISLQSQIDSFAARPRDYVAAVDFSISMGYQGLIEKTGGTGPPRKLTAEEQRQKNWEILEGKKNNESAGDCAIFESSDGSVQVVSGD